MLVGAATWASNKAGRGAGGEQISEHNTTTYSIQEFNCLFTRREMYIHGNTYKEKERDECGAGDSSKASNKGGRGKGMAIAS